ncbi:MAG: DUF4249 domain-containing protein [Gloeobacteraceae cyanobacterium ES-bin-316]|nr:DUF4249 domain-containing protein [Ferruginibacter sp.]
MTKWMLLCGLMALYSCEKDIDFDLKESEPVLNVDAQIENGLAPTVILTKSFSYYQQIDPALLAASFVRNAEVYLSNGTTTHRLKEYSVPLAPGFSAYYYSIDSADLATAFVGELNKTYNLRIVAEGKEYTAVTNIPAAVNFPDSLWFKTAPQNPDTSLRVLYMRATDPPGRGNYVRYFTKRNSEPFLPGENVFDDQVIDGSTYEIQLPQGVDRNDSDQEEDSSFYKRGDTVTLKFCAINKASYNFWNTWEFAYQSIGNPFAQPNKVLGNISNGALGVFVGYGAGYKTLIAP